MNQTSDRPFNHLKFAIMVAIFVLTIIMLHVAYAKGDPKLLIHAWCVPKTPQWPACARKVKCPPGWDEALAGMENCKK
jgi:hypothetical protein